MTKKTLKPDAAVAELAQEQHGLVTREQAKQAGLSSSGIDRRLASGAWELVHTRVYRMRGSPRSEAQRILAVCLHGGEGTHASHRTAAWLWKLDGFLAEPPRNVHVSGPHNLRIQLKGVELFRRRKAEEEYVLKEGIPTTILARTLIDLAAVGLTQAPLEVALDSAGRGDPRFIEELAELVAKTSGHGRKGFGILARLVNDRRGGAATGSAFETKVLRRIRAARLPTPVNQHPVFARGDRPFAFADFAWPDRKVILFADGASFHGAKRQFEKAAEERAQLTALGWRWIAVTPKLLGEQGWLRALATLLKA